MICLFKVRRLNESSKEQFTKCVNQIQKVSNKNSKIQDKLNNLGLKKPNKIKCSTNQQQNVRKSSGMLLIDLVHEFIKSGSHLLYN